MQYMPLRIFVFLTIFIVVPVGAARGIPYEARIGAKYSLGGNGATVGVRGFSGEDGSAFAMVLQSSLQNAELDGKQLLTITDDSPGVLLGGSVLDARLTKADYQKKDRKCVVQGDKWWKCDQWEERAINCEKFSGSYAVTVNALKVETKQVIFSQTVKQQGEYAVCEEGGGQPLKYFGTPLAIDIPGTVSSQQDPFNQLRLRASQNIRELIAPYNKVITVEFMSGTQGLSGDAVKAYRNGMEFASAGRLDRGCAMFQEIYASEQNQKSMILNYNLGVCNEALLPDDPSTAFDFYNKADLLLSKPNKEVSAALLRTKELVQQGARIP